MHFTTLTALLLPLLLSSVLAAPAPIGTPEGSSCGADVDQYKCNLHIQWQKGALPGNDPLLPGVQDPTVSNEETSDKDGWKAHMAAAAAGTEPYRK